VRIALLGRFPRVDSVAWKLELAEGLVDAGHELGFAYTKSALADQVGAGLREFGFDALARYRRARAGGGGSGGPTLPEWAAARGIPVMRHRAVGDPELLAELRSFAPDLMILAGAEIVPASLLKVPRRGVVNPHYALLPRYRGMNVAEWSVFHDDPVGVTVHMVDPGIDTGDILEREIVPVEPGDTLESIRAKQQRLSARLLLRAVEGIERGTAAPIPQQPEEGRQFYRMHHLLRRHVERKLASGEYAPAGELISPLG
jgi:folate-dependent phosphoribosylglycinamide formyltransferase PurN